ncbi:unnamed protein product [Phytophthora fragariaefolia]|uniref:Unnamed protein product n=1 Tax=Phytophthora fragariaefolia TaxID=1490495 RepID=A0A9W6X6M3_9STRA|nr:unnamed protein product [Phytophthora fragariaefolia]
MVEKQPQTPRKRKKRSAAQQSGSAEDFRAVCVASLCQKLAQCGLLTLQDAEFVGTLARSETLEVLRRVVGSRLLPLRLRMLLLGLVLQSRAEQVLEAAEQSWIQEVCEKILEEAREAATTGGSKQPPSKRLRTRSRGDTAVGREKKDGICGFCRDGASAESLGSRAGGWDFLVESTHRVAKVLEKAGETYATNQTMVTLSTFWDSLPVAGLATSKPSRRRKRAEIQVASEEGAEPLLPIAAYKSIVKLAVDLVSGTKSTSHGEVNGFQMMWQNVWEREFKNMGNRRQFTLSDVICHCSKADAFASIVLSLESKPQPINQLPGYCIVLEAIRSLFVSPFGVIAAFSQVWGALQTRYTGDSSRIAVPISSGASSTKHIVRSYLSELLTSPSARQQVLSLSLKTSTKHSPLEILCVLYELYSDSTPSGYQKDSYPNHWDFVLTQLSASGLSTEGPTQDGINWCLNLEECVHGINTSCKSQIPILHGSYFLAALQNYCLMVMYGVLASGGATISSGGRIERQLISEESDRSTLRRVLAQMMVTFGEGWISRLIAQLLRANASLHFAKEVYQRGLRLLLFPAFVSSMKLSSRTHQQQRKTGQEQFIAIVHAVNTILKATEPTSFYLVPLMRFCEAWDAYQSTHTKESPTRPNKWGAHAMIELDILPELLDCYGRDEIIRQETSESLTFAAEVLQNVSNCPPTLEELLYKVISSVKGGAESAKTSTSDLLTTTDKELILHSSDVLQRFLRAVKFTDLAQTRHLINEVKDAGGTLTELRKQLERWFAFVETHGTAFAGKESRIELALLCTRLIRWFPSEFGSMRHLLMTPLDSHLVFALKAFVKEAGKTNSVLKHTPFNPSASSLPAAVQVEMALHLYLSSAAFPDLETLTILLTKAMVKCRSHGAFNHLAKVAGNHARILLPETAVMTLSSPLQGLEFSASGAYHPEYEDDDATQVKDYARRAKSIIYQENTLKLLAMSTSVFNGGISWSTALFNGQSAETWLPYLFEYILETSFCEGSIRVDFLLASLEKLAQGAADSFKEGFWVGALLNTALVACSARSTGVRDDSKSGVDARVRAIAHKVLSALPIASRKMAEPDEADDSVRFQHAEILCLIDMSKCSWVILEGNDARWSAERFINDKTATSLRITLSGPAVEEVKNTRTPIQLFVPFSKWLSAALVYSQSFLEEASPTMRRWERTFTSYVTDLYLRLQFEDDTGSLLNAWLATWISSNIVRAQGELQLLALLPSQVALFRRLGLTPYRDLSKRVNSSTVIWQLIFLAINLAVDHHITEDPASIEHATELVVSTLTTLELVELSASSDFVPFSHMQQLQPFYKELEDFLSRPQLHACSAAQAFCLLQYPLELLVCCYACKIPQDFEAESQLFLQHVEKLLREFFAANNSEASDRTKGPPAQEVSSTLTSNDKPPTASAQTAVNSTEMDAFFQYWRDEMLLSPASFRAINTREVHRCVAAVGFGTDAAMYIGPWQEYRLAKIQDDAIQKLRKEWEAQLRGQLPPGEDDRIRELMQPLVAKLPSLLLAAKSRTNGSGAGGRSAGLRSGANSEFGSRCSSRPASARSTASSASVRTRDSCSGTRENSDVVRRHLRPHEENNQETHDEKVTRVAAKPPKPKKKGKTAPLTSLEQVQKRKKMFAKWIKQASNSDAGGQANSLATQEAGPETKEVAEASIVTRLPAIHSAVPVSASMLLTEDIRTKAANPVTLPPINQLSVSDETSPLAGSCQQKSAMMMSPQARASSDTVDINLDESLDEEEVNNFLNWTDTLLSPQAMESLSDFDD